MNYFFNKTMKTTSLNTIPFKSLLALLIQLKAKPKFKGQNEGGGVCKTTLCRRMQTFIAIDKIDSRNYIHCM